MAIISM